METILLVIFLIILAWIIGKIFFNLWFNSRIVNLENIGDNVIINYTEGGYMDMVALSIPIIESHNLKIAEIDNNIFHIGYEVEENSDRFFVYGNLKSKNGYLSFLTFLGKEKCRFLIFSNIKGTISDSTKVDIVTNGTKDVDKRFPNEVFSAMPWQKWGDKKFSRIRVDADNKLVPYGYYSKDWSPTGINEGFNEGNMPSPLP
jgi:hypothetical protein